MQSGILKRIEEKENEAELSVLHMSDFDLSLIDEKEKNLVR